MLFGLQLKQMGTRSLYFNEFSALILHVSDLNSFEWITQAGLPVTPPFSNKMGCAAAWRKPGYSPGIGDAGIWKCSLEPHITDMFIVYIYRQASPPPLQTTNKPFRRTSDLISYQLHRQASPSAPSSPHRMGCAAAWRTPGLSLRLGDVGIWKYPYGCLLGL